LGFQIISIVLCKLYPQDKINMDALKPLSWSTFIEEVLLPEAAIHLIMEDLGNTYEDAVAVLQESRSFGVIAFPGDEDHPAMQSLLLKDVALALEEQDQMVDTNHTANNVKEPDLPVVKVEEPNLPIINYCLEGPLVIDLTNEDSD
jgi:hypothetical protein